MSRIGKKAVAIPSGVTAAIDGGQLSAFWTHNPSVLGYLREGAQPSSLSRLLVLGNFSEFEQTVAAPTFSAMPESMLDLIGNSAHCVRQGITLAPYQMVWLVEGKHHYTENRR